MHARTSSIALGTLRSREVYQKVSELAAGDSELRTGTQYSLMLPAVSDDTDTGECVTWLAVLRFVKVRTLPILKPTVHAWAADPREHPSKIAS